MNAGHSLKILLQSQYRNGKSKYINKCYFHIIDTFIDIIELR